MSSLVVRKYCMIRFLLLLLLLPMLAFNQTILLEHYGLTTDTHFKGKEFQYIDSLFHHSDIHIQLVKLLPACNEKGNCFPETIIREDFNMQRQIADSVDIFDSYFAGVKKELIDFSRAVKVDKSDYTFFLQQLLQPETNADNPVSLICYEPRHAVLFTNASNEIIAVLEICFRCNKTVVSIYANRLYDNNAELFRSIFHRYGLLE